MAGMGIELYAHNQAAYQAALAMLQSRGRAAVVHPTGTGKSFIAFKLIEEHPAAGFLWLSPSEYIFKTQLERLSEPLENIQFFTYAKLAQTEPNAIAALQADYIVLDEFHRCGAQKWGEGVNTLLASHLEAKVLGLSATSVRYLDNQRDMAAELFEGSVASEMTLGEAILRDILPAPVYVTSVYSYAKELEKYQKRVRNIREQVLRRESGEYLEALRRALEQAEGLETIFPKYIQNKAGKFLVFCSGYEHILEMQARVSEWFGRIDPEPHVYTAYSDDPETSEVFAAFKRDGSGHLKLLFCIDMLNEGVHVDDLDGVVLFRPTVSPIVYHQQIGRALSSGSKKQPLIFDIVNNFENLVSIDSIQKEMLAAALRFYGPEQGEKKVEERFCLYDEVRSCREIFGALQASLRAGWERHYSAAARYYAQHGNLLVPKGYKTPEGLSLGAWITTQRRVRAGKICGDLDQEKIARLDAIGMCWNDRRETAWEQNYRAAQEYAARYGNLEVPARYIAPDGRALGAWIANQRQKYAGGGGALTNEQITRLEALGMQWDMVNARWEQGYAQAAGYYAKHGDLTVPADYQTETGFALGRWLAYQRAVYRGGKSASRLSAQQIERLQAIGMSWGDRHETQWNRAYNQAKAYYTLHGDLKVPVEYVAPDGTALGKWVARQRAARTGPQKQGARLTPQRMRLLDEIGMVWTKPDPWEHRCQLAGAYLQKHGNLNIPANYKTDDGIWLGTWLCRQKKLLRNADPSLDAEKIDKLKKLGIGLDKGEEKRVPKANDRAANQAAQRHTASV